MDSFVVVVGGGGVGVSEPNKRPQVLEERFGLEGFTVYSTPSTLIGQKVLQLCFNFQKNTSFA